MLLKAGGQGCREHGLDLAIATTERRYIHQQREFDQFLQNLAVLLLRNMFNLHRRYTRMNGVVNHVGIHAEKRMFSWNENDISSQSINQSINQSIDQSYNEHFLNDRKTETTQRLLYDLKPRKKN